MPQNKSIKFLTILLLLILSRAYDFIATYIYTPDLENESNLLVKLFDLSYFGVFVFQLILTSLVGFSFYTYLFGTYTPGRTQDVNTIKEFIGYFHYGKKVAPSHFLYRLPNLISVLYSIGYIVTYSLICIGFVAGTSTVFLITSEDYGLFYSKYGSFMLYTILVLIVLYFSYSFYKKEYNRYLGESLRQRNV
jgi:hypothetical protein